MIQYKFKRAIQKNFKIEDSHKKLDIDNNEQRTNVLHEKPHIQQKKKGLNDIVKQPVKIEEQQTTQSKQSDDIQMIKDLGINKLKVEPLVQCLVEQNQMENLMGSQLLFQTKFQLICSLRECLEDLIDDILLGQKGESSKYDIIIKVMDMNMLSDLDIVYSKILRKMITVYNAHKIKKNSKWALIIRSIKKKIKKIKLTLQASEGLNIDVTDLFLRIRNI